MEFEIGGVYKETIVFPHGGGRQMEIRILTYDAYEILYDVKLISVGWKFQNLKKYVKFSRSPNNFKNASYEFQNLMPLTDAELQIIRPHLPMRLGRIPELSWLDPMFENQEQIQAYLEDKHTHLLTEKIETDKIYLQARYRLKNTKADTLITADNGKYFTIPELIFKANQIYSGVYKITGEGIGIFRSGIKGKLPEYYIGEYIDLAGFLGERTWFTGYH
jgi:hypothetical protein